MSFTRVNLNGLPEPDVIEPLDYEVIVQQLKDAVAVAHPAMAPVLQIEGEPATKVLEVCAAFVLMTRARVNHAARGVMLAFASGTTLDHLAALFGVQRMEIEPATDTAPAVYEGDDDLRARAQLAIEGFSVAGPRGAYLFHALSAHPDVLDVSVAGPGDGVGILPGTVVISVVSRDVDGVPDAEVLAAVEAAVNDRSVRPLTDNVVVQAAARRTFSVNAVLHIAPDTPAALVQDAATTALYAYVSERLQAGGTVALSGIYAALQQTGVQRVSLTSPAADVVATPFQFPVMTSATITTAVG